MVKEKEYIEHIGTPLGSSKIAKGTIKEVKKVKGGYRVTSHKGKSKFSITVKDKYKPKIGEEMVYFFDTKNTMVVQKPKTRKWKYG